MLGLRQVLQRLLRECWRRGYGERRRGSLACSAFRAASGLPSPASAPRGPDRVRSTTPRGCLVIDRVCRWRCHRILPTMNSASKQPPMCVHAEPMMLLPNAPARPCHAVRRRPETRVRAGARLGSVRQGFTEGRRDCCHPCAVSSCATCMRASQRRFVRPIKSGEGTTGTCVRTPGSGGLVGWGVGHRAAETPGQRLDLALINWVGVDPVLEVFTEQKQGPYSSRSASTGATLDARSAGSHDAASTVASDAAAAISSVRESLGLMP